MGKKRELDPGMAGLVRTLTDLLRDRRDRGASLKELGASIGGVGPEAAGNWLGARDGIPPDKVFAAARALGLEIAARHGGDLGRRLQLATTRLERSQVEHLTTIAERLADETLDPDMVKAAAKLLDTAPDGIRPRAQQDQ